MIGAVRIDELMPSVKAMEDFTGTRPPSESHSFDAVALASWLDKRLPEFCGPLVSYSHLNRNATPICWPLDR